MSVERTAMLREDLSLLRYVGEIEDPVVVVAKHPPAWLRHLPRVATVLASLDEAACRTLRVGAVVLLFDGPETVPAAVLTTLQGRGHVMLQHNGREWRRLRGAPGRQQLLRRLVARALPPLAGQLGFLRLVPPFRHDGGFCWWASLRWLRLPRTGGDRIAVLFEDGRRMTSRDSPHANIRELGGGRYSVWERGIYFSTSDNSDPFTNGRRYEVRVLGRGDNDALPAPRTEEQEFAQAFMTFAAKRSEAPPRGRRVLLFLSSLGPGGAERQFCNLARSLAALGHEVGIASLDGFCDAAGHYVPMLDRSAVRLLDLTHPDTDFDPAALDARSPGALDLLQRMPPAFAAEAWRLATHVATFRPDVLHCALDKTNLLGAVAGVATGVPRIVLSMRNVNPTHMPHLLQPWLRRWYRLAAQVPGLVLSANSHAGAADYAQWLGLPCPRIHVVHNGLDTAALREPGDEEVAAIRRQLGIDGEAHVLLGVFRLSPEKQPFLWLEAVARLRERFPDLVAVHVGHGVMAEEVAARVAAHGLQHAVRLLGRRHDVPVLIRAADLLLLTSAFEGIPNVALEAQWLGRPVVLTLAGGSAEAVQHGVSGAVVTRHDAADIAAACEPLLADAALRARMGEAARRFVVERFGLDAMVERSLGLYAVAVPSP